VEKKLEELKKQREMAKELFLKCQGAIELIESMIKEENEQKDKKK
jgi:hypothetical protein